MEQFGLDPKLLIAQVINFGIFFFIFSKFIAKPLSKFIDAEKKKQREIEAMNTEIEEKHTKMLEDEKKWKKDLQAEKEKILDEAKKTAEKIVSTATTQAKQEASDILTKTHKQLEDEKRTLYDDVKKKTIDLSVFIINKGLNEYLTEDIKKNLTQYIVKNLSKEVQTYEN